MDISKERVCPKCKGTGEVVLGRGEKFECYHCNLTGKLPAKTLKQSMEEVENGSTTGTEGVQ